MKNTIQNLLTSAFVAGALYLTAAVPVQAQQHANLSPAIAQTQQPKQTGTPFQHQAHQHEKQSMNHAKPKPKDTPNGHPKHLKKPKKHHKIQPLNPQGQPGHKPHTPKPNQH